MKRIIGLLLLIISVTIARPAAADTTWVIEYLAQGGFRFPTVDTYALFPDRTDSIEIGRLYFQHIPGPGEYGQGWQFIGYWPAIRAELPVNFPNAQLQQGVDIWIYQIPDGVVGVALDGKVSLKIDPATSACEVTAHDVGRATLKPVDCAELVDLLSESLTRVPTSR